MHFIGAMRLIFERNSSDTVTSRDHNHRMCQIMQMNLGVVMVQVSDATAISCRMVRRVVMVAQLEKTFAMVDGPPRPPNRGVS